MFTPPEIPLSAYATPQNNVYLPSAKAPSSGYPHQYDSYGAGNAYSDNAYAPVQQYQTPYGANEFQRAASAGPQPAPSCKKIHHSQVMRIFSVTLRILTFCQLISNSINFISTRSMDIRRCKISRQNHLLRHQLPKKKSQFSINLPSHTNHQFVAH